MKLIFSIFLFISILNCQNLLQNIKSVVKESLSNPSNGSLYLNVLNSNSFEGTLSFGRNDVDSVLSNSKLNDQEKKHAKINLFSESNAFQIIKVALSYPFTTYEESIFSSKLNTDGSLQMGYIKGSSNGALLQQYIIKTLQDCSESIFTSRSCSSINAKVTRGLEALERNIILDTYRYNLFQKVTSQNEMKNEKQGSKPIRLFSTTDINSAIKKIENKIPELANGSVQQIDQNFLNLIVQRGFSSMSLEFTLTQYIGVKNQDLNQFAASIIDSFSIPQDQISTLSFQIKNSVFTDSQDWLLYDVLYSVNTGGNCKYLLLLSKTNTEQKTTDWLSSQMETTFKLADDIFIQTKHESSFFGAKKRDYDVIVQKPKNFDPTQTEAIVKFFQLETMQRFEELKKINIKDGSFIKS